MFCAANWDEFINYAKIQEHVYYRLINCITLKFEWILYTAMYHKIDTPQSRGLALADTQL